MFPPQACADIKEFASDPVKLMTESQGLKARDTSEGGCFGAGALERLTREPLLHCKLVTFVERERASDG
eukprot:85825-Pyramimonas_sp.AAC.1